MTPAPDCPFCSIAQGPGFALRDAFPVTDGLTLVIPKRHVPYAPATGQTVAHLHIHLIPRYGDEGGDPRGSVRRVVPGKADYWSGD